MLWKKVEELDPWEVQDKIENSDLNSVIIDVRELSEFVGDMGHISGAINIPASEFTGRMDEIRNKSGYDIILVCHTGDRSYAICRYLMDQGFQKVSHIRGGMVQWHLSGLEVKYE